MPGGRGWYSAGGRNQIDKTRTCAIHPSHAAWALAEYFLLRRQTAMSSWVPIASPRISNANSLDKRILNANLQGGSRVRSVGVIHGCTI